MHADERELGIATLQESSAPPDSGFELRHLRYFVAVAEELHFGRAAKALNISQPPLSRQIQDLERSVGTQLLNRTGKSVTLTEAGTVFLTESKRILAQVYRSVDLVRTATDRETPPGVRVLHLLRFGPATFAPSPAGARSTTEGALSRARRIAPNAFIVGRSGISGDRQHAPNWCQIAMTGDCFVVGSSCARPGVVTASGDSILVCAQGQDVALLESLDVGWIYSLYGHVVETLGAWKGAGNTNRFHLLPAGPEITVTRDNCGRSLLEG